LTGKSLSALLIWGGSRFRGDLTEMTKNPSGRRRLFLYRFCLASEIVSILFCWQGQKWFNKQQLRQLVPMPEYFNSQERGNIKKIFSTWRLHRRNAFSTRKCSCLFCAIFHMIIAHLLWPFAITVLLTFTPRGP